jgi:hypothetical protein
MIVRPTTNLRVELIDQVGGRHTTRVLDDLSDAIQEGSNILLGPAREGLALLQGLLVCGNCGRALTVRYTGNGGIWPTYLCSWLRRDGLATKDCMSFRCDLLDAAVSEEVLKAMH